MRGPERVVTARPFDVQRMLEGWRVGVGVYGEFACGYHVEVGLMGSWLEVMRGCVHGLVPWVGTMGEVAGMNPLLNAVSAVGPERVVLLVSWS
jgi:hypothetical protein